MTTHPKNLVFATAFLVATSFTPAHSAPAEACSLTMQKAIEQLALPDAVSSVTCTPPMTIRISRYSGKEAELIVVDLRDVDTFGRGGGIEVFCAKKGCVRFEVFQGKPSKQTSSNVSLNYMHSIQADRTISILNEARREEGVTR
jgi:hypothetical protein